jgi:hypothetical protein
VRRTGLRARAGAAHAPTCGCNRPVPETRRRKRRPDWLLVWALKAHVTSQDQFGARDQLGLAEAPHRKPPPRAPPPRHRAPQAGDPGRPGLCAGPAAEHLAKEPGRASPCNVQQGNGGCGESAARLRASGRHRVQKHGVADLHN